jgi:DNA-binding response OmpR family regulator
MIAEFGGWRFNLGNNRLIAPNGEEHALSTAESELLKVFVNNPNRILQREKLMCTRDLAPTDRAIDVRISRLRRKLEPDAQSPAFIKTVYGAGYLFLATVSWSGDNS